MNINVRAIGVDAVMRDFTERGIKAQGVADKVTETYTRKMANESGGMAPVKSGDLRADVIASPRRLKLATWAFGSNLAYARRQEYEHASHKGFIRKSVWNNRTPYREAVKRVITK